MKSDYKSLLFCLVVLCGLVGIFFAVDSSVSQSDDNRVATPADSAKQALPLMEERGEGLQRGDGVEAFPFDPNTADSTTLLQLGLPRWMVRGIYKFRAMGGVYSIPEDFARVPGLTQKQYKALLPYIRIGADFRPASELISEHGNASSTYPKEERDTIHYPKKLAASERLALNTADTTALKRVPGIGSFFAKKIVAYRQKLGGFVSLDQLLEIKNFPESSLAYLTVPDGGVTRLNINKASFKQLSTHPYIGYSRTKAIFRYRQVKGRITSLSQLSLQPGFSQQEIEKMEPYVEY